MSLNEIMFYKPCIVLNVENEHDIARRFLDIGIIPGAKIEKVLSSPFGGIQAYSIMSSTIAIRDQDAKGIKVRYEEV